MYQNYFMPTIFRKDNLPVVTFTLDEIKVA